MMQPFDVGAGKLLCHCDRGELRRVQYFIGVGIANSAEQVWIGQGSFERVIPRGQCLLKILQGTAEHFKPSLIEGPQGLFSLHQME
jgi:hypothetical protein